eukprot:TRINITY_DN17591_c0_g1_i2.p1 TRINITY_DN17591_c0_g1~~TRINITY_DN17591_c0_g1_i2.p1  ORF type:complete len:586 (+),score=85.95 TRINITY_DN17591_c0_g1_i2:72-1829(+)
MCSNSLRQRTYLVQRLMLYQLVWYQLILCSFWTVAVARYDISDIFDNDHTTWDASDMQMEDIYAVNLLQADVNLHKTLTSRSQDFPYGFEQEPMNWAFSVEYWPVFKAWSSCQLLQLLAPMLLYVVAGSLLVLFYFRRRADAALKTQDALAMSMFVVFMENLIYSVLFVDSMAMASSNSAYEVFPKQSDVGAKSGMIIGTQKMGTAVGTLLMFLLFLNWPYLWRTRGPIVYATGLGLQMLCALTFSGAGMMHVFQGFHGNILQVILGASRFLQGLGGGIQVAFGLQQSAHLVSGKHRAVQNTRFYLGACLGMGAGPLLVSAAGTVSQAVPCDDAANFETTIGLIAVLPFVQLPPMCRGGFVASLDFEDAGSLENRDFSHSASRDENSRSMGQSLTVIICLVLQVLRSLAMAAIEAAVSHLLHEEYQWSRRLTGLATAVIIFAMLPVQLLYEKYAINCSVASFIRLLLVSAFVGSFVLAIPTDKALLLGCVLSLPSMALSSGLIMGTMQAHALPDGSILDLNKTTLLSLLLSDFIGRGLGPAVARVATSSGGQKAFAWQQCVVTAVSIVLYEIMDRLTMVTKDAEP